MTTENFFWFTLSVWVGAVAATCAFWAAVVYVVMHFLMKVW
jgi:hypothetical protein